MRLTNIKVDFSDYKNESCVSFDFDPEDSRDENKRYRNYVIFRHGRDTMEDVAGRLRELSARLDERIAKDA